MPANLLLLYRGFELHPLVFARTFSHFDGHSRYADVMTWPSAFAGRKRQALPGHRVFSGWKGNMHFRTSVPLDALHTSEARTSSMEKWLVPRSPTCEIFIDPPYPISR